MTAVSFREMLQAQPFRPFLVETTDGDAFRVDQPDYALVNPAETEVVIFDKDGRFRIVLVAQVVFMEPVRDQSPQSSKR